MQLSACSWIALFSGLVCEHMRKEKIPAERRFQMECMFWDQKPDTSFLREKSGSASHKRSKYNLTRWEDLCKLLPLHRSKEGYPGRLFLFKIRSPESPISWISDLVPDFFILHIDQKKLDNCIIYDSFYYKQENSSWENLHKREFTKRFGTLTKGPPNNLEMGKNHRRVQKKPVLR